MRIRNSIYYILLATIIVNLGCAPPILDPGKQYYLAHNIWFERPKKINSINYKTGTILPAGSKVNNIGYIEKQYEDWSYLHFKLEGWDYLFLLEIGKFQKGLTLKELAERTFVTQDFEALTHGLTREELQCIKAGIVREGMSKRAVIIALGYPPRHRTLHLTNNVWYYWLNRWESKPIHFNSDGIVISGKERQDVIQVE